MHDTPVYCTDIAIFGSVYICLGFFVPVKKEQASKTFAGHSFVENVMTGILK